MSVNLQAQIRDNSRDLNAFLKDLNEWTGDVKEKDAALKDHHLDDVPSSVSPSSAAPPPVRGRVADHKVQSEADLKAKRRATHTHAPAPSPASTTGTNDVSTSKSESSKLSHKDRGNACFKSGDFSTAIEHYTKSITGEGPTAVSYANRAMSYLKLENWSDADCDCEKAIEIDPLYLKAHQRRGVARSKLKLHLQATMDYENALRLEPTSKILKEERLVNKQKHEQNDQVRITQTKRLVPIIARVEENKKESIVEVVDTPVERPVEKSNPEKPVETGKTPVSTVSSENISVETQRTVPTPRGEKQSPVEEKRSDPKPSSKAPPVSQAKDHTIPLKPPKTSFEFESGWKRMKSDPESSRKYAYLNSIDPEKVQTLFRGGVPVDLFSDIIVTLLVGCNSGSIQIEHGVEFLESLTKTPRFDVAVMFVSGAQKQSITEAWHGCEKELTMESNEWLNRLANVRKAYKC